MEQATLSLARAGAPADGMLAVDIRRADIETALESAGGGSVELLLDIARRELDGDGSIDRHTLSVDCTSADLERMLEGESDTVRIGLDAEALARAIDEPDFEAHGLREKLAVLAVVVATTGAVVGTADARPAIVQGGGTGATVTVVRDQPADTIAAAAAASQSGAAIHDMASDTLSAATASPSGAAGHDMASDTLSAATASPSGAAGHDMASDTLSAATASPSGAAGHDMASDTLSAATASPSGAAGHDMASDTLAASETGTPVRDLPGDTVAASGVQPGLSVRDMPGDVVSASTASSATAAGATSDRGSIGSDGIDATQFVVVGAGALALLGAAFAAAGVSRHKPKPS